MSLSKEDKELLEWLWDDENTSEWIENFIYIDNKEAMTVPFGLTKQQHLFVQAMTDRNIVLKGRQMGFSLISLAMSLKKAITVPNSNSLIVSFEQKSADDNFDKLKVMYDNLPKWIKPKVVLNNRQVLKLANGSKITCRTVGKGDLGRGGTINGILHLTEFPYYKSPMKCLNSAKNSCTADAIIIIESTAKGTGNAYHKMYIDGKSGKNEYKSFFFSWLECPELFEREWDKAVEKYKALYGRKLTLDDIDLDEEEQQIIKLGGTPKQLMWRRLEIATVGIDKFHEDRPITDMEAFLTTGESMVDTKRIDSVERSIIGKDRQFIHKLKLDNLSSDLKKYYGKEFKIYHDAKKDKKYYIGVDVAEGYGGDYSVIEVYNTEGQECAMFRSNKIKPYQFSKIVDMIGRYYNKGFLLVEKASGGHTVIDKLRNDFKYQRLYKYKSYDEKNRQVTKWGFDTNPKTKGLIINNFIEMFETGLIEINSVEVLEEMKVFTINDSGKMGAMNGFHDDTIMATALALQGIKEGKWWRWI
ncbi:phage terminase large subunit family protein [Clostridium brassicae]|uniref:Terminase n=1 Tax=Clostridium brassicae TaxID=2999072 RepID=A0ABT4DB79_9CLOT|nr:terminase [Clostridium brassicae]MCY6958279.1 terminase [Clostridium brassicae]